MKLATVDPLPGINWNAKAAAGDALQRVSEDAPFIAIWVDSDGILRMSQAGMTTTNLSLIVGYMNARLTDVWVGTNAS